MEPLGRLTISAFPGRQLAVLLFDADLRLLTSHPDVEAFGGGFGLGSTLPDDSGLDALIELLESVRERGGSITGTLEWPDGKPLEAFIKPMGNGGYVAILQGRAPARDPQRMESDFLSTAAHELKNPISNILGFSEILPKVGPLSEKQEQFVHHIFSSAEKMNYLVQNLLDLEMMKRGNHMETEVVDINAQVLEVVEEFQATAQTKNQALMFQGVGDRPKVHGDALRLRRVLHNLVGNALKYTPANGKVTVSVVTGKEAVLVRVEDNGVGIPVDALPMIFEPFYRVKNTDTKGIEGNGLGLAIVKSIVEQHGGHITVQSEPRRGSCFTLALPLMNSAQHSQSDRHVSNFQES